MPNNPPTNKLTDVPGWGSYTIIHAAQITYCTRCPPQHRAIGRHFKASSAPWHTPQPHITPTLDSRENTQ
jgi:hypothetical protein